MGLRTLQINWIWLGSVAITGILISELLTIIFIGR